MLTSCRTPRTKLIRISGRVLLLLVGKRVDSTRIDLTRVRIQGHGLCILISLERDTLLHYFRDYESLVMGYERSFSTEVYSDNCIT